MILGTNPHFKTPQGNPVGNKRNQEQRREAEKILLEVLQNLQAKQP